MNLFFFLKAIFSLSAFCMTDQEARIHAQWLADQSQILRLNQPIETANWTSDLQAIIHQFNTDPSKMFKNCSTCNRAFDSLINLMCLVDNDVLASNIAKLLLYACDHVHSSELERAIKILRDEIRGFNALTQIAGLSFNELTPTAAKTGLNRLVQTANNTVSREKQDLLFALIRKHVPGFLFDAESLNASEREQITMNGVKMRGQFTYYEYQAPCRRLAEKFLNTITVEQPGVYHVVDFPEGSMGKDQDGLYIE